MSLINKIKDFKIGILVGISFILGVFFINEEKKEWERCHKQGEGKVKGFSLYSNKSLQVEIEYQQGELLYTANAPCTDYLRGCFYSKNYQKCIGQKCIVYYACDNPKNIRYKLIEQDSIKQK